MRTILSVSCLGHHFEFVMCLNLFIVTGDLFGRINAQHGTLFPEEQVNLLYILMH